MGLVRQRRRELLLFLCALQGLGTAGRSLCTKESKAEYGSSLTVGITEEATVEIGTLEQRFELDISALVDSTTAASGGQTAAGAMPGGFGGMGNGGSANGSSGMLSFGVMNVEGRRHRASLSKRRRKDCSRAGGQGGDYTLHPDNGKCGGDLGDTV